jgi:membrane protein YqaA with SNARE-associated domain
MTMTEDVQSVLQVGPIRRLYDWVMRQAGSRHAFWALGAVSFAESSFFPIPPDIMLVPMILADRKRAFVIAAWCTLTSVLGGILGYAIGALLYDSVGGWLIRAYGMASDMQAFRALYNEWGAWIILIKGATPIPYKLVTIASGFAGYNLPLFILLSAITRGARFGIVAGTLYWVGEPARAFIEKRLELVLFGFLALIVLGFVVLRYVF